jgi:cytochrome oxidase Cu insertion factor (SCO1/SenC/PrrC family)
MTRRASGIRALVIATGVVLAGVAGVRWFMQTRSPVRGVGMDQGPADYGSVPAFSLTDRTGRPVDLEDLKGKVWVANFIFTRCTGPCPLLTSRMARLHDEFKQRDDVRFVSFSVDPAFDTPKVLSEYAQKHGAASESWHFLTGDTAPVHRLVSEGFRLAVAKNPDARPGAEVDHSTKLALVSRDARIVGYYSGTDEADLARLRKDIRRS